MDGGGIKGEREGAVEGCQMGGGDGEKGTVCEVN